MIFSILLGLGLVFPAQAELLAKKPIDRREGERKADGYEIQPPTAVPQGMRTEREDQPWPIRLMIHPMRKGMFIGLPIVDTDPNRGVTMGFMPIWVIQEPGEERIRQIWAPSVSYNKTFKVIPTFRFYTYPTKESDLVLRASLALVTDREVMGEWHDRNFRGSGYEAGLRLQYNGDGSKRFFGIGPDASLNAESNYIEDVLQMRSLIGVPLGKDTGWYAKVAHHIAGMKISDGPINSIPDLNAAFPGSAPFHRHQNSNLRLSLDFDSRDHDVTTTEGSYFGAGGETSQRKIGSEFNYQMYSVDLKHFHPWWRGAKHVTAGMVKFQQIQGRAPFWLMPQLGGKYIHRAYGEGRFIDRGMITAQAEHRYTFYSVKMAGVTTDFELAPFAGVGEVFDHPAKMTARYARPVFGGAVRAVARPQVVGSIDFGIGQEGMTAFMDINYSW